MSLNFIMILALSRFCPPISPFVRLFVNFGRFYKSKIRGFSLSYSSNTGPAKSTLKVYNFPAVLCISLHRQVRNFDPPILMTSSKASSYLILLILLLLSIDDQILCYCVYRRQIKRIQKFNGLIYCLSPIYPLHQIVRGIQKIQEIQIFDLIRDPVAGTSRR